MPKIKTILLPVDFPNASFPVIHQAAKLAHKFQSEFVFLHIMTDASHIAGVPEEGPKRIGWNLPGEIISKAPKNVGQSLKAELEGISIHSVLAKGNAAQTIVQVAQEEKADLIMMPSRGHTFDEFLLGTAASKVGQRTECPIWTGANTEALPAHEFAIRNVLCAVDFNLHDRKTVSWAEYLSKEFGAHLTLAHVTAAVEFWGPGGGYINQKWKHALVSDASQQMARLQADLGIRTDILIGSGYVPTVLNQLSQQTKADLLISGSRPYGSHLRTHGFAIISAMSIPVLSV